MPRIASRRADQLLFRRRFTLGVRMLGCLIMLAGLLVLAAALAVLVRASAELIATLAALGFALFAGGVVLFRGEHGKLLDRRTLTLKCWWRVVVPLRVAYHALDNYQAVRAQPVSEGGASGWRVCLVNAEGESLDLFDVASEEAAQAAARQVGAFLSLAVATRPVIATADIASEAESQA